MNRIREIVAERLDFQRAILNGTKDDSARCFANGNMRALSRISTIWMETTAKITELEIVLGEIDAHLWTHPKG